MTQTVAQSITVNKHQADLLLWCYEQMVIDLSDSEMDELEPLIIKLDEVATSWQTGTQNPQSDPFCVYNRYMNNSIKTKSLFSQSIDLTDDYLSFDYTKTFSSNMFDKYTRDNNLDPDLSIYHYGNDRFVVQTMDYTYNGCLTGDSVQLGQFYDIYEAQDCAEDYLKDLVMSQGV